jgi:esterase/lipase superfamily enzyme
MAFELPVVVTDPYAGLAMLAAISLAALAVTWWAVSGIPARAKLAARALAAGPLLVFPVLFAGFHLDTVAALRDHTNTPQAAADPDRASQPGDQGATSAEDTRPPAPLAAPSLSTAPPTEIAATGPVMVLASRAPSESLAARPADAIGPLPAGPATTGRETSIEPIAVSTSAAESVSLVFVTDRAATAVGFGPARAKGLTFGRAEVAVGPAGRHGAPGRIAQVTPIDGLARLIGSDPVADSDHVLLVVPGFATDFETALVRSAHLARTVGFQGTVAVYSWPSAGDVEAYEDDLASVTASAAGIGQVLDRLTADPRIRRVTVLAIGLGARPVLEAVARRSATSAAGNPGANSAVARKLRAVLLAPDVDRQAVRTSLVVATRGTEKSAKLAASVGGHVLLASARDRGLDITRRHVGAVPRAGDLPRSGPFVSPGLTTVALGRLGADALSTPAGLAVDMSDLARALRPFISDPGTDEPGTGNGIVTAAVAGAGFERVDSPDGSFWHLRGR